METVEPQKHAGGRPSKYHPSYCDEIIAFFSVKPFETVQVPVKNTTATGKTTETVQLVDRPNDLPMFGMFAHKIGVHRETLTEWCRVHPEFSEAYKKAQQLQENFLTSNALRGNFEQPFAIFTAKNILGWRDRQEILELKFVFEFVGKLTPILNSTLPDKCPHCKGLLALREPIIKQLEELSRKIEVPT